MKTARLLGILAILLLVTISVSAVNPQTIVVGKIYNQTYGGAGLGSVAISINCDGTVRTGSSQSNGDYGINFDNSVCHNSNPMTVTLSKSGYNTNTFTNPSILTITQGTDEILIVNFVMTTTTPSPTPSTGGGSGGGGCTPSFWDCPPAWTECIDGTQTRRCSSNCGTSKTETQSCTVTPAITNENQVLENSAAPTGGFFSAITGAFIGTLGTGWSIAIIFVVLVGGALTVVMLRRKRNKK